MTFGGAEILVVLVPFIAAAILWVWYEPLSNDFGLMGAAVLLFSVWLSVAFGTWLGQFL